MIQNQWEARDKEESTSWYFWPGFTKVSLSLYHVKVACIFVAKVFKYDLY